MKSAALYTSMDPYVRLAQVGYNEVVAVQEVDSETTLELSKLDLSTIQESAGPSKSEKINAFDKRQQAF